MTKIDLLKYFATQYQLAKFLNVSHQAIYKWAADKPIPELRALQLEKREKEWKNKKFANLMRQRARRDRLEESQTQSARPPRQDPRKSAPASSQ